MPFDTAPAPGPEPAAGPLAWSVSALLLALGDALSARFGAVAVRGELSGWSRAASGHVYFALKDADGAAAMVRCVMFRRATTLLDFAPADGQRVELRGRLSVYEPRGDVQLVVEAMRRQGPGSLYEEFLRLRARLEAAGLFDPARRRPLARHPETLAVVTSLGAAALHDVVSALERRAPHVRVVVHPCLVQGPEAPASIVRALQAAAAHGRAQTVLLVRGGGSIEDLWAFNDEHVVRAVSASPIPVVCGVGHETDVTLCDLAADLRAPTPTAAAELAAPARDELQQRLALLQGRLAQGAQRQIDRQAQRLDGLARRAGQPALRLQAQAQRLTRLNDRMDSALVSRSRLAAASLAIAGQRLQRALVQALRAQDSRHEALALRLRACHPQQVLNRGYAWVLSPAGRPVMGIAGLEPGMEVQAVFRDGRARARVLAVSAADPAGPAGQAVDDGAVAPQA
jgi:exodeoxyribonuclease VII large subunit